MTAQREKLSAVEAWQERLTYVNVDAGEIAVFVEGSGTPVVLLHGIPTHSYLWRDVAPILSFGQRVIAIDLAGFGFSDKGEDTDISPGGQATMVFQVLDALDVETCVLVGHDYGALVGCEMLTRDASRIEKLVVTNTSLNRADWTSASGFNPLLVFKVPLAGEAALKLATPSMLRQAFRVFVSERQRLNRETMSLYWHPFETGFDKTLLRLARETRFEEDDFHRWKAALYDYTGPSLVVWGGKDPALKVDRAHEVVRLLHDCRYELFVHSNHFIQEDRPMALGRLISSFAEGKLTD